MGRDRGVELPRPPSTPAAQGAGRGGNEAETCTKGERSCDNGPPGRREWQVHSPGSGNRGVTQEYTGQIAEGLEATEGVWIWF